MRLSSDTTDNQLGTEMVPQVKNGNLLTLMLTINLSSSARFVDVRVNV